MLRVVIYLAVALTATALSVGPVAKANAAPRPSVQHASARTSTSRPPKHAPTASPSAASLPRAARPPTVVSVTPHAGLAGRRVTVRGAGLADVRKGTFDKLADTTNSYGLFIHDFAGHYAPADTITTSKPGLVYISGTLTHNTTWSATAAQAYIIKSTLDIPAGITLTVDPGTIVKALSDGLSVQGSLSAVGTRPARSFSPRRTTTRWAARPAAAAPRPATGPASTRPPAG
jgi:hypothetical protein